MTRKIKFHLNEKEFEKDVDVRESLLELIRGTGATGTKEGCGAGECGACTVLLDGQMVDSCIYLAVRADGKRITTIEGVAGEDGALSDLQQSLVDAGAVQCGFCTPGIVMAATCLLSHHPNPTRQEIRRGLSGNLCRCTGYTKIIEAVENTARSREREV